MDNLCRKCKKFSATIKSSCQRCYDYDANYRKEKAKNRILCLMKHQNGSQCNYSALKGYRMCKRHKIYEKYGDEELNNLIQCSGCKIFYLEDEMNGCKTCDKCKCRDKKLKKVSLLNNSEPVLSKKDIKIIKKIENTCTSKCACKNQREE